MAYEYTWEPEGLYRRFYDQMDGEDILKSNFELHQDTRFSRIKYVLNDFRDITSFDVSSFQVETAAVTDDIIANSKGRLKIALLATNPDHQALCRLYKESLSTRLFTSEVFSDLEEAKMWCLSPD